MWTGGGGEKFDFLSVGFALNFNTVLVYPTVRHFFRERLNPRKIPINLPLIKFKYRL